MSVQLGFRIPIVFRVLKAVFWILIPGYKKDRGRLGRKNADRFVSGVCQKKSKIQYGGPSDPFYEKTTRNTEESGENSGK